jgi:transposase
MPILTIKAKIHATPQTEAVLKDTMLCATKVYNGLLWHLRKEYKETGKTNISRKNLNRILKELPGTKGYYSMSVQLTRDEVIQAYKSFLELRKQGLTQHHAPGFRRKSDLSPLKYVQSGFRVEGKKVTPSPGTSRQDGVKSVSFRISHRPDIQFERIRQISIRLRQDFRAIGSPPDGGSPVWESTWIRTSGHRSWRDDSDDMCF